MSGLSTRLNSIQVSDPGLRLFLQSLAKAVDRINVNFHLDINEPTALSEPTTGANALAAVVNVPPAIMIVKSLRFLADKNGLYQASAMTQGARAWHSAAQSPATGVLTGLAFDSEYWDTDDMHDLAVNNTRLTFNTAGIYVVGAHLTWAANGVGTREAQILKNNATILDLWKSLSYAGAVNHSRLSTVDKFDAGDYIEVKVLQDSGGALAVNSVANYSPVFFAHRLS